MVNLLGLPEGAASPLQERLERLRAIDGASLHWYEKGEEIPGRKLGHITLILKGDEAKSRKKEAEQGLKLIRSIWPINDSNPV